MDHKIIIIYLLLLLLTSSSDGQTVTPDEAVNATNAPEVTSASTNGSTTVNPYNTVVTETETHTDDHHTKHPGDEEHHDTGHPSDQGEHHPTGHCASGEGEHHHDPCAQNITSFKIGGQLWQHVKIPFGIGLWVLLASVAKLGKCLKGMGRGADGRGKVLLFKETTVKSENYHK